MTAPLYVEQLIDAAALLTKRPRTVGELIELTQASTLTAQMSVRKFVIGLREEGVVYVAGVRADDPKRPSRGSTVYAWQPAITPDICAQADATVDPAHRD